MKYWKVIINKQDQQTPLQCNDVDYSVCKGDRKCKNKADRKMIKALDKMPYDQRQWGHFLARNIINTKQKPGVGVPKKRKKAVELAQKIS